jgi:prephenate dehydrogenase
MKHWDTVAIVGVGLIGGSIGLALRERKLAGQVIGVGRRPESIKKAKAAGAVDQTTQDLSDAVRDAELIIVCTPVDSIARHVREAAAACPEGALLTDAGSTKASIVRQLNGTLPRSVAFVGSHPLAGSEKIGCEHARANLFDGRVVVVTPTRKTSENDLQRTADFWSALGASVMAMPPAAHDRALAATSHLPHLLAAALARGTAEDNLPLTAGGWRDCTRIAAGDAELWTQILLDNRDNLLKTLGRFEKSLAGFRTAIERGDPRRLGQLLKEAKRIRDAVGS